MAEKLYFDDIAVGDAFTGATVTVERDRLLAFAEEFDDQAMHLDAGAARAMGLDDVIAPGAYIFALTAKSQRAIWHRMYFLPSGLGIEVSFLKPVYPGDELTAHATVTDRRASSKPGRGWLSVKIDYVNQREEIAVGLKADWLLKARDKENHG